MARVITVAQQKGGAGKTTLAANLAVALTREGEKVALLDTDPQGSLGRWFMTRIEAREPDMEFGTASAWGAGWEVKKLAKLADWIVVDTPPKADGDLRGALKIADLVLVPVSASQLDVWAVEGVLDLARGEGREALVVLTRARAGTRVQQGVSASVAALGVPVARSVIGSRTAYAESLGAGKGAQEMGRGPWTGEVEALAAEVRERLA